MQLTKLTAGAIALFATGSAALTAQELLDPVKTDLLEKMQTVVKESRRTVKEIGVCVYESDGKISYKTVPGQRDSVQNFHKQCIDGVKDGKTLAAVFHTHSTPSDVATNKPSGGTDGVKIRVISGDVLQARTEFNDVPYFVCTGTKPAKKPFNGDGTQFIDTHTADNLEGEQFKVWIVANRASKPFLACTDC